MSKVFSLGIILGLALSAAAAWYLPLADLHREPSIISVQPNGGNAEIFQVLLPEDRIVAAGNAKGPVIPEQLSWPDTPSLAGVEVDIFKLRNRDNVVVGLASRIAASGPQPVQAVEWTLHLPARGTLYFPMPADAGADGYRTGALRAGTQEFAGLSGNLRERYIETPEGARIELRSMMIGTAQPAEAAGP
ncbi:MAG: hypothetical protein U5K76_09755 [Woeseiaceae bacterium]|nr:hypothetical protein [Woeseiaceae bacterium]